MTTIRQPEHIVDTNYLLCFGAIPQGIKHLKSIFGGGLATPPAVKAEIDTIATGNLKAREIREAADRFRGTSSGFVAKLYLKEVDTVERDEVLRCIASNVIPVRHPGVFPEDLGADVMDVASGQNAGEAEAIPLALRLQLPFLTNDTPAKKYALTRGVSVVEGASESLKRIPALGPKEKYRLYRGMVSAVGDAGPVVRGWTAYREPSPRTPSTASSTASGTVETVGGPVEIEEAK